MSSVPFPFHYIPQKPRCPLQLGAPPLPFPLWAPSEEPGTGVERSGALLLGLPSVPRGVWPGDLCAGGGGLVLQH